MKLLMRLGGVHLICHGWSAYGCTALPVEASLIIFCRTMLPWIRGRRIWNAWQSLGFVCACPSWESSIVLLGILYIAVFTLSLC